MLLYQSGQLTSTALSGEINFVIENNLNQVTKEVWNNYFVGHFNFYTFFLSIWRAGLNKKCKMFIHIFFSTFGKEKSEYGEKVQWAPADGLASSSKSLLPAAVDVPN